MSEPAKSKGRPHGSRVFSKEGRYGRPEITVRLDRDAMDWVKERAGSKQIQSLVTQARRMPPAIFPASLEVTEALSLWWTPGAQAEVQVNKLAQEVTPLEARAMAGWLLAYADEAEKEKADG